MNSSAREYFLNDFNLIVLKMWKMMFFIQSTRLVEEEVEAATDWSLLSFMAALLDRNDEVFSSTFF